MVAGMGGYLHRLANLFNLLFIWKVSLQLTYNFTMTLYPETSLNVAYKLAA